MVEKRGYSVVRVRTRCIYHFDFGKHPIRIPIDPSVDGLTFSTVIRFRLIVSSLQNPDNYSIHLICRVRPLSSITLGTSSTLTKVFSFFLVETILIFSIIRCSVYISVHLSIQLPDFLWSINIFLFLATPFSSFIYRVL